MNGILRYFWIFLYILLDALNKHKCQSFRCYDCENCSKFPIDSYQTVAAYPVQLVGEGKRHTGRAFMRTKNYR
ncbi:unnamed protein product [Heterobilharzia americana]|nr:unnamed protein product [Heterobilharzia americana]